MSSALREPGMPVIDIDAYSNENIDDPFRFYEALREAGPVVWLKPYNMYAVGRFDDEEAVLSDDTRFWCTAGVGLTDLRKPESLREKNPLLEVEPAEHAVVRSRLMKIMSPALLRKVKSMFEQKAEELVDKIIEKSSFDGVHDLVEPYILSVFPATVGINVNPETVLLFGNLNFNANGPFNELYRESYKKVEEYLPEFEASFQRRNLVPGGMAEQIYEAEDAGDFKRGTAIAFVRVLFRAGFDTTIAGIAAALHQLAQSPESWEALRARPETAASAFDEALRHGSPARVMHRVTIMQGCEFHGVRLEGDVKVGAYIAAANLDPRKWENPEKFEMQREGLTKHLAFGAGPTKCLGLLISKYEAEAMLKALAKRVKTIELVGSEPLTYRRINTLRTLESLPLRITV
jgi:cytochrome P450